MPIKDGLNELAAQALADKLSAHTLGGYIAGINFALKAIEYSSYKPMVAAMLSRELFLVLSGEKDIMIDIEEIPEKGKE